MYPFEPYFNATLRKGIATVVTNDGEVRFRNMKLAAAERHWKAGLQVMHLTEKGALKLYSNTTAEERLALLQYCKTTNEVSALLKLPKNTAAFKKAAAERMQQWIAPPPPPAPALPAAKEAPAPSDTDTAGA